jgi:hypothetical protein
MARDGKSLLLSQAKKDPTLQTLIDDLETLTSEQIDVLIHPKWIRDALKVIKSQKIVDNYIATRQVYLSEDFSGDIVRYEGSETFAHFGASEILVYPNDLLFVTTSYVWLDTAFAKTIDPRLSQNTFVKTSTFSEYMTMIRKMINDRHPEIINTSSEKKPMFTIKQ